VVFIEITNNFAGKPFKEFLLKRTGLHEQLDNLHEQIKEHKVINIISGQRNNHLQNPFPAISIILRKHIGIRTNPSNGLYDRIQYAFLK
jgi:hypothetical protein